MNFDKEIDTECRLGVSERELLAIILHEGQIARSEITKKTNLAQQSVHRIIDNLERRGYLRFGDVKISGRGKPSPMVSVDPDHYCAIGLAISTENIRFCLLDLTGRPIVQETANIESSSPKQVMDILLGKMACWAKAEAANRTLVGAGISMQGFRTGPGDRFQPPHLLPEWVGLPLETILNEATGLPTFAENNSTASALAEYYLGGGGGQECITYLSFNHGFGAGIYAGNRPFLGGHGNAGEIGAIYSEDALTHRPALAELRERLIANGVAVRSVIDMTTRLDPNWPGVDAWLEEIRPQLHLALRALQAIADPNTIFFGGEAPAALRQLLLDAAEGAFRDNRLPKPAMVISQLQGDPAHLGAGLLPLHRLIF